VCLSWGCWIWGSAAMNGMDAGFCGRECGRSGSNCLTLHRFECCETYCASAGLRNEIPGLLPQRSPCSCRCLVLLEGGYASCCVAMSRPIGPLWCCVGARVVLHVRTRHWLDPVVWAACCKCTSLQGLCCYFYTALVMVVAISHQQDRATVFWCDIIAGVCLHRPLWPHVP
jgi:hypothetical protein